LKNGGHVRVIVDKDEQGRDKIGFQFLEGRITPKPEKLPAVRPKAKRRASPKPKGDGGGKDGGGKRGSVPKVPLLKA
jgi:ATP-dependent Clp protease ATP-binding subunit ClpA